MQANIAGSLQRDIFHIHFGAMRKILPSLLLAAAFISVGFQAVATEQVRKTEEAQSFFDRYTNAAQDVILHSLKLVGVRYRFGGNTEDSGLDCSGFVRLVFKDSVGEQLPRTSVEMSQLGKRIDTSQLRAGDLVFFNTMRRAFSHVGIYLGDNRFMHAPRTGAEVRVEDMSQSYWVKRYNGARRVVER